MTSRTAPPKGLGRGLSALLGDTTLDPDSFPKGQGPRAIALDLIAPNPKQPRKRFAEGDLDDLIRSVKEKGILQPILLRPDPERAGRFQIVAGERRFRAAQAARLHEVPAVVRPMTDAEALEIAIIENVQRADLNPIEEAQGYRALIEEFGHTQDRLAAQIGKSRSHIANTLRLLNLPGGVQALVEQGDLSAGHARALVTAKDPDRLAAEIVRRGLSVREAEALAKEAHAPRKGPVPARAKDADTRALERDLSAATGCAVTIAPGTGEAGVVSIRYGDLDTLDELVARLKRV
jgi:ParB family transcriptional regulator, chromosome partitioning protein